MKKITCVISKVCINSRYLKFVLRDILTFLFRIRYKSFSRIILYTIYLVSAITIHFNWKLSTNSDLKSEYFI